MMTHIKKGYTILPRVFYESEIGEKPPHFREVWQWLIKEAAHKEIKIKYVTLTRGQLLTSYNRISEGLKWYVGRRGKTYKISEIESALKYLTRTGMITKGRTKRGILITISKYDYYQDARNYESQSESQTDKGMKARRKPSHNIQELNNEKNERSICGRTHGFSKNEIKQIFILREKELCMKANEKAYIRFYHHYNKNEWKSKGSLIKDIIPFIDEWIETDEIKRDEKNKPMIVTFPERYKPKEYDNESNLNTQKKEEFL